MTAAKTEAGEVRTQQPPIDTALRLAVVALLMFWCALLLRPFLIPVLWGIIIAIGVYPFCRRLSALLGHRDKLAAVLFTVVAFALLIVPAWFLADSAVRGVQVLSERLTSGDLTLPPPPDSVASWPVVGEPLHRVWSQAATNLQGAVKRIEPELREHGAAVLSAAAGIGLLVLQFAISILIAGAFLARPAAGQRAAQALCTRLAGPRGVELAALAAATVRSVVQGVLGVALIQAVLVGAGMLVAGVPLAGLWAILVLVLVVVQLPPLIVMAPIILYVFSKEPTSTAVLFTAWSLVVCSSDLVLKPLLFGRGVDVPMLAILLGAIGGMVLHGIIGLFVGAVVLALTCKLYQAWVSESPRPA